MNNENLPFLKDLFQAIFYERYNFDEFMAINAREESKKIFFKKRTAYKANEKLSNAHLFIRHAILQNLKINDDIVFSFRHQTNHTKAIYKHRHNSFFFITDFKDFFSSITREDIRKMFLNNISNIPAQDFKQYIDDILNIILIDDILPIGFSTSPLISNAVLYEFDMALNAFCLQHSISYSRYADDLIFSALSEDPLALLPQNIQELSQEHFSNKLVLNPYKSKFLNKSNKIKIMGNVLLPNGLITVDRNIKNKLESALHIFTTKPNQWEQFLNDQFPTNKASTGINRLSGLFGYVNSVDPDYIRKLKIKYGVLAVDLFLKKKV